MDEHIGNTIIEHAACDSVFPEDEKWKTQSKQNTGLQMVPWSRKGDWGADELLSRSSGLANSAYGPKLLETKNNASRAVACDKEDLTQRKLGRIIGASQSSRFEVIVFQLSNDYRTSGFLRR